MPCHAMPLQVAVELVVVCVDEVLELVVSDVVVVEDVDTVELVVVAVDEVLELLVSEVLLVLELL